MGTPLPALDVKNIQLVQYPDSGSIPVASAAGRWSLGGTSGGLYYRTEDPDDDPISILDALNSLEITAGGDQSANTFVAGPTNGSAGTPAFRAIDYRDITTALLHAQPIAASTLACTTLAASGAATFTTTGVFTGKLTATKGVLKGITVLAAGSTPSIDPTLGDVFTLTPAQAETISAATVPATSQKLTLIITTSGSSSYTLTFGTNFKSTGTLATGTSTAKVFVICFESDGTNFNETSRTTAM